MTSKKEKKKAKRYRCFFAKLQSAAGFFAKRRRLCYHEG